MTKIYEQHDKAFARVSAYVVLKDGACVAKVQTLRSASNLRTTAFVHWLGSRMTKGAANGGGYDKESASIAAAAHAMPGPSLRSGAKPRPYQTTECFADDYVQADTLPHYDAFRYAASLDGGKRWADAVRDAGFTVIQAV
jgi:hypothetical protein